MFEDKKAILEDSMKELLEENKIDLEDEDEEELEEENEEAEDESEVSEEEVTEEEDETEDDDKEFFIESDDNDSEEESIIPKKKPTPEEKQRYAFEKLRKEAKEKDEKLRELDEIAIRYGFTSHAEMVEQLKKDSIAKEAKKQGIDPAILEKIQNQEKELNRIKQEREEEQRKVKVTNFLESLDSFTKEYKLNDSDRERLLVKLEDDGYTLDTLLNIRNPKNLFKGYVQEKIAETVKQKSLEAEEKKKKLAEKRMKDTGATSTSVDLDKYLDELIKKSRGSRY